MDIHRALATTALAAFLLSGTSAARAASAIGAEWWFGAGVNFPDYHDGAMAVFRGGAGATVIQRLSLGANAQGDRDHWFGFGYFGVLLPAVGSVEPYGRLHYGKRDDTDDNVSQWSAGLRYGAETMQLYVEVFGIIEPGYGTGVCFGLAF